MSHRFTGAIMAYDKCEGFEEFYDILVFRTKGPDALDQHLHNDQNKLR